MDLGHGKYDANIAAIDKILTFAMATPLAPDAAIAREFLDGLVELNKATAPAEVVLAGDGMSYVPSTNSKYNRETGEFIE